MGGLLGLFHLTSQDASVGPPSPSLSVDSEKKKGERDRVGRMPSLPGTPRQGLRWVRALSKAHKFWFVVVHIADSVDINDFIGRIRVLQTLIRMVFLCSVDEALQSLLAVVLLIRLIP